VTRAKSLISSVLKFGALEIFDFGVDMAILKTHSGDNHLYGIPNVGIDILAFMGSLCSDLAVQILAENTR